MIYVMFCMSFRYADAQLIDPPFQQFDSQTGSRTGIYAKRAFGRLVEPARVESNSLRHWQFLQRDRLFQFPSQRRLGVALGVRAVAGMVLPPMC